MAYFRASLGGGKDYAAGQGLDITNDILSLKTASSSQQGGAVIDGTSITLNSNNQIKALLDQTVTLSDNTSTVSVGSTDVITASTDGGGTLSVSTSDSTVATAVISNGEVTITGVGAGSAVITVSASASGDYGAGSAEIGVSVAASHIYGVQWDGLFTNMTRTDEAADFVDPMPQYNDGAQWREGSSPFDNLMPWSGMRIVEDENAGTLVEIPKFWYKWTQSGRSVTIKISNGGQTDEGWQVSPAHQNRDGTGERNYIYVGRYHCSSNTNSKYKSITRVTPQTAQTRDTFRQGIHNLGSYIWQYDYATLMTIWLLYIVEFASWNSQSKIGFGGGNVSSSLTLTGNTDNMTYHTGTNAYGRDEIGSVQYRHIEGLWDNCFDFVDGIVFAGSSNVNIYLTKNPANFDDTINNKFLIGTRSLTGSGLIQDWNVYNDINEPWFVFPGTIVDSSDYNSYICDRYFCSTRGEVLYAGGPYNTSTSDRSYGLFCLSASQKAEDSLGEVGSRLMVLPPSRLSPP